MNFGTIGDLDVLRHSYIFSRFSPLMELSSFILPSLLLSFKLRFVSHCHAFCRINVHTESIGIDLNGALKENSRTRRVAGTAERRNKRNEISRQTSVAKLHAVMPLLYSPPFRTFRIC